MNEFVLLASTFVAFLVVLEVGFRLGRRRSDRSDESDRVHVGSLQAAVLGLLALLLGFSFAMAVSRFDLRKGLVVEEANAIGTAFLRARFLPVPYRVEMEVLFRDYEAARLAFYEAGDDPNRLDAADAAASSLERRLWAEAATVVAQDPRSVPAGLFAQSLNDVIDIRERRRAALSNHVPETVIYLLFAVSVVALGLVAYGCGLAHRRRLPLNAIFALLIALVLTTILDMDRPRRGLIQVSQDSLLRLKATLDQEGP